jgi:rhodanese-related sulfurtransferase
MEKKPANVFSQLQVFEQQILNLEEKILQLDDKMKRLLEIERNHLIRIKNGQEVSDDFIQSARTYLDLSPEKSWQLYKNKNFNFILLDVSSKEFSPVKKLPEAIHIPWEELPDRFLEISSRTTPILVISEDGAKSVLACEFLVKCGFYNCNNISGGYKYWRGFRLEKIEDESA